MSVQIKYVQMFLVIIYINSNGYNDYYKYKHWDCKEVIKSNYKLKKKKKLYKYYVISKIVLEK
jgi:hypothetical protein